MSGIELESQGWKPTSGGYTAFMGGIDLDLRAAEIPEGEAVVNLTAVVGAIEVKLPRDLEVDCRGTPVLGGVTLLGEEAAGLFASRSGTQVHRGLPRRSRSPPWPSWAAWS